MATVEFRSVWKRYGSVEAVKNLNLVCKEAEFLALLGPSGCGKTSSLRMLAGLEEISEGEILIGGRRVNEVRPKDRDIAMVFEDYALYPHMTATENIAFPLKIRGMSRAEIRERVERAIGMLGLEDIQDQNVQGLSGGAQQRVSIGRAIVRDPQVMLMDEPISHLDSAHKVELRGELKRLQRTLGVSTVYVTHDQIEAMALADRVAVMNLGMLQQVGPPEELYNDPANLFVAGFIGEPPMNVVDCEFDGETGEIRSAGFAKKLSGNLRECAARAGNGRLVFGIRPSNTRIATSPDEAEIRGECYALEPRGDRMVVLVHAQERQLLVETESDLRLDAGDPVGLVFPEERIHLFDEATGANLVRRPA